MLLTILCYPLLVGAKFVTKPKSTIVEEGDTATFACAATGQPPPVITWSKSIASLPRQHLINKGGISIPRVSVSDAGVYICRAKNLLNTDTSHALLTVVPSPKFTVRPPRSITASTGGSALIPCSATGAAEITWRKVGGSLSSGHVKHANGTLALKRLAAQDAGTYKCTARNFHRSIAATSTLQVRPSSCTDIKAAIYAATSGSYVIDPDDSGGVAPFTVYCDMSDKNGVGVTVIRHDTESRIHLKSGTCLETPGCYSRNVSYNEATIPQITSLSAVSTHCEQFIKYECHSVMFIARDYAWWVSRDGSKMRYWGGASPGTTNCACGMTNSCMRKR